MLLQAAFPLLFISAYALPTHTQRHCPHLAASDFQMYPTAYPTGYSPLPNGTITEHSASANATYGNASTRWLPSTEKVRGVNLGSQFIIEPWMAYEEWNSMGCGYSNDEWSCVDLLGQDAADSVFATHWDTWTTKEDIADIASLGLNVIRIPIGFWIREDLVEDGEHYPRGGLQYLDRLVGWAADEGLYVIMDLHGGPGSQYPNQQFTGRGVDYPGFYTAENYERAIEFLEWLTARIHSHHNYRTTGVLQVMNEPVHGSKYFSKAADMVQHFYPAAYSRVRRMERALGIDPCAQLKIQYMGDAWGAGNPTSALPPDATDLLFDDHRYYKWDESIKQTKEGYVSAACSDDRGGDDVIIGEWSLGVNDDFASSADFAIGSDATDLISQYEWYQSFWAAQVQAFERSGGWIFWTWKCNRVGGQDDWRWCYKSAVENGIIPKDASLAISLSPCS